MGSPKAPPPGPPPAPVPDYSDAADAGDQTADDILRKRASLNNSFLASGQTVPGQATAGRPFLG